MESRREMLKEGLVAGLLGYVTIAAFYALVNVARGEHVLSTARILGEDLVGAGLAESMPMAPVLAYNGVHVLALLVVGTALSWLIHQTERRPELWYLFLFSGALMLFFGEGAFFVLAEPVYTILPWWSVAGANLAGGLVVGVYLYRSHRSLVEQVEEMGAEST